MKAQQSQTIRKITASPIFISTQLLFSCSSYLTFQKEHFFLLSYSVFAAVDPAYLLVKEILLQHLPRFLPNLKLKWMRQKEENIYFLESNGVLQLYFFSISERLLPLLSGTVNAA